MQAWDDWKATGGGVAQPRESVELMWMNPGEGAAAQCERLRNRPVLASTGRVV